MKGKRVIAGILLVGILTVTLAGCKHTDVSKTETEKPVITLGSDNMMIIFSMWIIPQLYSFSGYNTFLNNCVFSFIIQN